jgi:hypothetical protein
MPTIKKGDKLIVPDSPEPLIASRDEYNNRVWAMTARDYEMQGKPGSPGAPEEPYLILPDRTLIRHYEHGFSDEKYAGK